MKRPLALVCVLVAAGLAGVVMFGGAPEEEGFDSVPRRAKPARRAPIIGAPPKNQPKLNFGGGGGFGRATGGGGGGGRKSSSGHAQTVEGRYLTELITHYQQSVTKYRANYVIRSVTAQMERLRDPLLEILRDPDHPSLIDVINIAGRTGEPAFRLPLVTLARTGSDEVKVKAMYAVELIKPWEDVEIEEFLFENTSIISATLRMLSVREKNRPTHLIIDLLDHASERVQDAALAALPGELKPQDLKVFLNNMQFGSDLQVKNSLRALLKMEIDTKIEEIVIDSIHSASREIRVLSLLVLGNKPGRLLEPEKIWRPEILPTLDDFEHAHRLFCLEKTRSYDAEELAANVWRLAPLPRYFAARCLASAGDKRGVATLLELIEELERMWADDEREPNKTDQQTFTPDDMTLQKVNSAARLLMTRISRIGPYIQIQEWHDWLEKTDRFRKLKLSAHGVPLR